MVQGKRNYFRISKEIPANVFIGDRFLSKALIVNLSTNGIGVLLSKAVTIPESFHVSFKLGFLGKTIKALVEIRNRRLHSEKVFLACQFIQLSEKKQSHLRTFILNHTEMLWPKFWMIATGFFFCVEAFTRLIPVVTLFYLSKSPFGAKGTIFPMISQAFYFYLFYSILCAFLVFLLGAHLKWRFSVGCVSLVPFGLLNFYHCTKNAKFLFVGELHPYFKLLVYGHQMLLVLSFLCFVLGLMGFKSYLQGIKTMQDHSVDFKETFPLPHLPQKKISP